MKRATVLSVLALALGVAAGAVACDGGGRCGTRNGRDRSDLPDLDDDGGATQDSGRIVADPQVGDAATDGADAETGDETDASLDPDADDGGNP